MEQLDDIAQRGFCFHIICPHSRNRDKIDRRREFIVDAVMQLEQKCVLLKWGRLQVEFGHNDPLLGLVEDANAPNQAGDFNSTEPQAEVYCTNGIRTYAFV